MVVEGDGHFLHDGNKLLEVEGAEDVEGVDLLLHVQPVDDVQHFVVGRVVARPPYGILRRFSSEFGSSVSASVPPPHLKGGVPNLATVVPVKGLE